MKAENIYSIKYIVKTKKENLDAKKLGRKDIKTEHLCIVKRAKIPGEAKNPMEMYIKLYEKASCTGNGAKKTERRENPGAKNARIWTVCG